MEYKPTTQRFVAVLNKKIPVGRLMNCLGHMTAGMVSLYGDLPEFRFQDYIDADGGSHTHISDNPFIILRSDNGNQLRTLRNELLSRGIKFTDFTDTMIEGTYADQHERTKARKEAELDYFGVCFFAEDQLARELTRKFSLFQ